MKNIYDSYKGVVRKRSMLMPNKILNYFCSAKGQNYTAIHHITQDLVKKFALVSGDSNPLHVDKEYAEKSIFGQRISHGMLPVSFIQGWFESNSMKLDRIQIKFIKPIYLDEKIAIQIKTNRNTNTQIGYNKTQNGIINFQASIKKFINSKECFAQEGNLILTTLVTGSVRSDNF